MSSVVSVGAEDMPRVNSTDRSAAQWECCMAGIKQNGILGQLLRDSWLAFTEGLL